MRKDRQKRCKKLSLKEKLQVIELFEEGIMKNEIYTKFGVTIGAICYVITNKEKYVQIGESKISKAKTRIDNGVNPVLENISNDGEIEG